MFSGSAVVRAVELEKSGPGAFYLLMGSAQNSIIKTMESL